MGTPVGNVDDYRLVVDRPSCTRVRLPRRGNRPRYRAHRAPSRPIGRAAAPTRRPARLRAAIRQQSRSV